MSQTGKLLPNIDRQSTKLLNLTVLQRIDPCIEEILLTAAHVTFYEFNIDSNQWSRKDVEGSLFVVKRNTQPGFQFIVMNRRNTENLVENLLGDFEYEVQMPYLLYRNSAQEVNGIWFYNSRECEDVANIFSRILDTYSKVPLNPEIASSKSEFEEQVSSVTASKQQVKSSSTALGVNNAANDSSTNFFQAADKQNSAPTPNNPGLPYHSSGIDSSVSASSLLPSPLAPHQVPSVASSAPSVILAGMHDASDSISKSNQIKNLLKPSTFYTAPYASSLMTPHVSSSNPSVTPQPSITAHRPYGTPLLQPFPPPAPSSSLTPDTSTTNSVSFIDRDKVRDALIMLVQDNQFIDMICQALQKVHHT